MKVVRFYVTDLVEKVELEYLYVSVNLETLKMVAFALAEIATDMKGFGVATYPATTHVQHPGRHVVPESAVAYFARHATQCHKNLSSLGNL